jgi:hypothetical protein
MRVSLHRRAVDALQEHHWRISLESASRHCELRLSRRFPAETRQQFSERSRIRPADYR